MRRPPIKFADTTEWDHSEPPPAKWAVCGHIPSGHVTLLGGEGGMGKSMLALQLVWATVTGASWLGHTVSQGPALYFGGEDEEDELRRRLHRLTLANRDVSFSTFKMLARHGLHIASYVDRDMMLARVEDGLITHTPLYESIWYKAQEIRPKIIVFDPLAEIYPGDENNRGQTTAFMTLMHNLAQISGAAVVICSHPSQEGMKSGSGTSGNTAWHAKARARGFMRSAPKEPDVRILEWKKNQFGPLGESMRLRFENGVFVRDEQPEAGEPAVADRLADQVFMQLLDRYEQVGRNVTDKAGTSYAPARFANEPEAKAAHLTKKALGLAMTRLFAANSIRVITEGPKSKQRSRIIRADDVI